MSNFETVHTMTDHYDGPREGIADFCGVPHFYESTYADVADKPGVAIDVFRLSPVTQEVFELALEKWAIWLRWETAFHRGELTPDDAHPALLVDRHRHEELKRLLTGKLAVADDCCVLAHAEFRVRNDPDHSGLGFKPLEVAWTPLSSVGGRESFS
jgi:hypothetical protein